MVWFDSYKNHLIHMSIYLAALTHFIPAAASSETLFGVVVNCVFLMIFIWALKSEIKYVVLRIRLPPGDSGWPIMGHLLDNLRGEQMVKNEEMIEKYGTIITKNMMMTPTVCFLEDEDVAWVQSQERFGNTAPTAIPLYSKLLGDESVIFSSGALHKRLRRTLEPAFSPRSIKDYIELLDNNIQDFLKSWNDSEGYQGLDEVSHLAMHLFFVCAIEKVDRDLLKRLNLLFEGWMNGFGGLPIRFPDGRLSKGFQCKEELHNVLGRVLEQFKQENPAGSPGSTSTLLGRLCYGKDDEGNTLSDKQLIENMLILVFAGHDTTKGSVGSMFYYLTEHPELYNLLSEEAKGFKDPLDAEELKKAPILNAFLAETWRLMSPVCAISTAVTKDLFYKGYHLPKGIAVAFLIQNAHADEKRFPKPNEFQIARWLPKDHPLHDPQWFLEGTELNGSPVKFRTFGGGPHMCLGMHFAKLEARIIVTRLVQKYSVKTRNSQLVTFPLRHMSCEFQINGKEKES